MMILKPFARRTALALAGIGVGLAVSAHSEIAELVRVGPKPGCDDLQKVIASAVNDKVRLIALTSPDPSKYFSAASPDSCLSGISVSNLDLSRLIPDPMGLLSAGVDGMVDGLKKAALGAACVAARNSVSDTIGKYNNAIAVINDGLDVRGQIDTSIGEQARQTADRWAMNWSSPQQGDALAGARLSGNVMPTVPQMQQATSVQLPVETPSQQQPKPAQTGLGAAIFGR